MPTRTKITSFSLVCSAILVVFIAQTLISSESIDAQHPATGISESWAPWDSTHRTTIDFDDIGDHFQVGAQGPVVFGAAWFGALDIGVDSENADPHSPDMVALMWDRPTEPADTQITFQSPVLAVTFTFTIDVPTGFPSAVFFDTSGIEIGRRRLGEGRHTRRENQTDPVGYPQTVAFVVPPDRGISHIEFEVASSVFGCLTIDDLTIFGEEPIFSDGFETGTTEMWSFVFGANPTATPTPTPTSPSVTCPGVYYYRELDNYAPYWPYLSVAITNYQTDFQAEIIRTRFVWPQTDLGSYVDYFSLGLGGPSTPYWSTPEADPLCWWSPCEFSRGDHGWNREHAVIPPVRIAEWRVYLGELALDGYFEVCIDVEFNDDANTVCTDICKSNEWYNPTPTMTPTPTVTPRTTSI